MMKKPVNSGISVSSVTEKSACSFIHNCQWINKGLRKCWAVFKKLEFKLRFINLSNKLIFTYMNSLLGALYTITIFIPFLILHWLLYCTLCNPWYSLKYQWKTIIWKNNTSLGDFWVLYFCSLFCLFCPVGGRHMGYNATPLLKNVISLKPRPQWIQAIPFLRIDRREMWAKGGELCLIVCPLEHMVILQAIATATLTLKTPKAGINVLGTTLQYCVVISECIHALNFIIPEVGDTNQVVLC